MRKFDASLKFLKIVFSHRFMASILKYSQNYLQLEVISKILGFLLAFSILEMITGIRKENMDVLKCSHESALI